MAGVEHDDYCPDKGDRRCDCDWETRVLAAERERIALDLRRWADELREHDVPTYWIYRAAERIEQGARMNAHLRAPAAEAVERARADERQRIAIAVTDLPDALTGVQDNRAFPTVVDTDAVLAVIDGRRP